MDFDLQFVLTYFEFFFLFALLKEKTEVIDLTPVSLFNMGI